MATERERLLATLNNLHTELLAIDAQDPEVRDRLRATLAEIEDRLRTEHLPPTEEESSLTDRLSEAARDFEYSHPTFFGSLGSVIDALARMGI